MQGVYEGSSPSIFVITIDRAEKRNEAEKDNGPIHDWSSSWQIDKGVTFSHLELNWILCSVTLRRDVPRYGNQEKQAKFTVLSVTLLTIETHRTIRSIERGGNEEGVRALLESFRPPTIPLLFLHSEQKDTQKLPLMAIKSFGMMKKQTLTSPPWFHSLSPSLHHRHPETPSFLCERDHLLC